MDYYLASLFSFFRTLVYFRTTYVYALGICCSTSRQHSSTRVYLSLNLYLKYFLYNLILDSGYYMCARDGKEVREAWIDLTLTGVLNRWNSEKATVFSSRQLESKLPI